MFSVSSKLLPKIFNSIKCWVYVLHKILVLNLPWGRNYKEMMKVFGWHYCKLIWDIVRVSEINTLYLHSISWFTQKKILFHLSFMTSGDLSKILLTQLLMLNWSMLKFLSLFEPKCMERYCIKPEAVMNTPQTCWYCCSVTKLCPALFDLMDCSTPVPEFVLHYLPEFAQTHVHWVGDTIQSFHLLLPRSPALNLSSIRVFPNKSALCIRWPKYWSFSFSISSFNEYSGTG